MSWFVKPEVQSLCRQFPTQFFSFFLSQRGKRSLQSKEPVVFHPYAIPFIVFVGHGVLLLVHWPKGCPVFMSFPYP